MKFYRSIFFKLLLLFLASVSIMATISIKSDSYVDNEIQSIILEGYKTEAGKILSLLSQEKTDELNTTLANTGYEKVAPVNGETLYRYDFLFGHMEVFRQDSVLTMHLNYMDEDYYFYNTLQKKWREQKKILEYLIAVDIVLMIIIFLYVVSLFIPLKRIQKSLDAFGRGDLELRINNNRTDEYKNLTESFNIMAENLQKNIHASKELLRNVSHELKTPIAKGRFVSALLGEDTNRERLEHIFQNMDKLTDDLLLYEKLGFSQSLNIQDRISAKALVIDALNRLMCEEESASVEVKNDFLVRCDREVFPIALKNLIDNAIKYSSDQKAHIVLDHGTFSILNSGDKLKRDIKEYIKLFSREKKYSDIKGFGLGLGIVSKIVSLHGFRLAYTHQTDKNIFCIITNPEQEGI